MLNFDPSRIEAKREGRVILANIAGIPLSDVAHFFTNATHQNFRSGFNAFTKQYPHAAKKISDSRPDGVGPGEMIAWFIFDNLTLGGKNAALDLLVDGLPFAEMKGGSHTKKTNTLDYFKITKDTDKAVSLIMSDLVKFNATYESIMGYELPGWEGATSIKVTALAMWASLNLTTLRKITPFQKRRKYVPIDPDGSILNEDESLKVGNICDVDVAQKLQNILETETYVKVDSNIDTLEKIVGRWKKQAFKDYISGKNIALIDTATFEMKFFGEITDEMLGLYRVHRNQPWARIFLDKISSS